MTMQRELLRQGLLAVRDPLARIALAAGELDGVLATGERARHAESVRSALAEADARLGELARALGTPARGSREASADCRAVFLAVCERAQVAAGARGVRLASEVSRDAVPGDAGAVRRATLRALRVAAEWAGASGALRIALSGSANAVRIECTGERLGAAPRGERARDLLVRFALAENVRLAGVASLAGEHLALELSLAEEAGT